MRTEAEVHFHVQRSKFAHAANQFQDQAKELMVSEVAQAEASSHAQYQAAIHSIRGIASAEQQSQKLEIMSVAEQGLSEQRNQVVAEARSYLESVQEISVFGMAKGY